MAEQSLLRQLVRKKCLTRAQEEKIVAHIDEQRNCTLKGALRALGIMEESQFIDMLERVFDIPYINLGELQIDEEALQFVGEKLARQHNVIPLMMVGECLTVATEDPFNVYMRDDVKSVARAEVKFVLGAGDEIRNAIEQCYGKQQRLLAAVDVLGEGDLEEVDESDEEVIDLAALQITAGELPIVQVVNSMITQAVSRRASDIHLEPEEHLTRLRYRIDGALEEAAKLPKSAHSAIIGRIKIMAGLDIAEHRAAQDGRFRVQALGRVVNLRVSMLPMVGGEKACLRILDEAQSRTMDGLGIAEQPLARLRRALGMDHGMILIAGPTGSGKTTTLYACLAEINTPEKNIITLEDPVEYRLRGINQVRLNPRAGLTFATALRSILRQDPDVVMVGEIRDQETAEIAFRACLTGHLMFSTIHTGSAVGAVARLSDMGVPPFITASGLIAAVAQRLIRRICPKCQRLDEEDPALLARFGLKPPVYRGRGCGFCRFTGYAGRFGAYEMLFVSRKIRAQIYSGATSEELQVLALKEGLKPLHLSGAEAVSAGITTLDEVMGLFPLGDEMEP